MPIHWETDIISKPHFFVDENIFSKTSSNEISEFLIVLRPSSLTSFVFITRFLYKKSKSKSKHKRKGLKYRKSKSGKNSKRDFEDKMNRRGTAYSVDKVPYMPM